MYYIILYILYLLYALYYVLYYINVLYSYTLYLIVFGSTL